MMTMRVLVSPIYHYYVRSIIAVLTRLFAPGTQEQAIYSIQHLQRILHKKHALFKNETGRRRHVPNLSTADLASFVEFSFSQISQKQIKYAKTNFAIFIEFVTYSSSKYERVLLRFLTVSINLYPESAKVWLETHLQKDPDYIVNALESTCLNSLRISEQMNDGSNEVAGACENVTGVLVAYSWLLEHDIATVKQLLDHPKSQLLDKLQSVIESHQDSILKKIQDPAVATSSSARKIIRIFRYFVIAILYFVKVLAEHDIPPIGNVYLSTKHLEKFVASSLYGHIFQQSQFVRRNEVEDIMGQYNKTAMIGSLNIAAKILSISVSKKYKQALDALSMAAGSTLSSSEEPLQMLLSTQGLIMLQIYGGRVGITTISNSLLYQISPLLVYTIF